MLITTQNKKPAVQETLTNTQRRELNELVAGGIKAVHEWLDRAEKIADEVEEVIQLGEEMDNSDKLEIDWDEVRKARQEMAKGLSEAQSIELGEQLFGTVEEPKELRPRLIPRIRNFFVRTFNNLNPWRKPDPTLDELIALVVPFQRTPEEQAEIEDQRQQQVMQEYEEAVIKMSNLRPMLGYLMMSIPPKPSWAPVLDRIEKLTTRTRIKAGPVRSVKVRPGHTLGLDVQVSDEIELSSKSLNKQVAEKQYLQTDQKRASMEPHIRKHIEKFMERI